MRMLKSLVLALLAIWLARPALAETVITGEPNIIVARFTTNPSSVAVDVKEVGGLQIANDLNATHETLDAALSDVWFIDLSLVVGYPTDCTQKTYVVRFQPNGIADCSATGTPGSCSEQVVDVGGGRCKVDPEKDIGYVRTTTPVSAQGISQSGIEYEGRRGRAPIRWRRIHFKDRGFTRYEVFFYKDTLGYPHLLCTAETTTSPATMTPTELAALGTGPACIASN